MPVIHTLAELDNALQPARPQFLELRVETPDGAALHALLNGDSGWLMYLRENGDAGFSSRNPAYAGPADSVMQYRLDNGQVDEYPASWALPAEEREERDSAFFAVRDSPRRGLSGTTIPATVWSSDARRNLPAIGSECWIDPAPREPEHDFRSGRPAA